MSVKCCLEVACSLEESSYRFSVAQLPRNAGKRWSRLNNCMLLSGASQNSLSFMTSISRRLLGLAEAILPYNTASNQSRVTKPKWDRKSEISKV